MHACAAHLTDIPQVRCTSHFTVGVIKFGNSVENVKG